LPDLAAGPPEIAPDGLSVTVRIRPDVVFSPPDPAIARPRCASRAAPTEGSARAPTR